jgi:TonB family protein
LRHIHNRFLKNHPELKGEVVLKMTLSPSGRVLRTKIVRSTTGVKDFEEAVRKKIAQWYFEPIVENLGDVEVQVLLNFHSTDPVKPAGSKLNPSDSMGRPKKISP